VFLLDKFLLMLLMWSPCGRL